ncbi:hypothetical protein DCC81_12155 [Chitinophaga parva]|uniref:Arm DNA-binding domain-containing protein n=1 Tax=Chitinophaga parva TaxID=2169414 RepID=A0A2T7BFJ8_9BACT|nr:Arm DNA-binding domain-containing protein [Chitinophaga parva]PUZ25059.1 hypothetical protein DCC81_12155 [Chitinophaga parva]
MNALRASYKLWLNKAKFNKKGENTIYLRLQFGGNKAEMSTGVSIPAKYFDEKSGNVSREYPDVDFLNLQLDNLIDKYREVYKKLSLKQSVFTVDDLKNVMLNGDGEQSGLIRFVMIF